ncbi:MAG: DNA/RNA nuclease SfsA [Bacteriovoracaceae bacterium]|nr:DNA/RNA nuclease SfsA [Bacteriovoracaceae bacterium]
MKFAKPLVLGKIQNRYKRFFADVILENGEKVVAHVPNTGSMKGTWEVNGLVALQHSTDPKRKLSYTLVMSFFQNTWIGVHTGLTNQLVQEYLDSQKELTSSPFAHESLAREVTVGDSRLDFCLTQNVENDKKHFIEVKNVTMADIDTPRAIFPDSVTSRGLKHLGELQKIKNAGHLASLFFCIQRADVKSFRGAHEIDPAYVLELKRSADAGVKIFCGQWSVTPHEISFMQMLPWNQ